MRASVLIARHYRAPLTLPASAAALACSPGQLQRAVDEIGQTSFGEQLRPLRDDARGLRDKARASRLSASGGA